MDHEYRKSDPLHRVTAESASARHHSFDGDDPAWAVAATDPATPAAAHADPAQSAGQIAAFVPYAPDSFQDAGVSASQAESLVLKFLLNGNQASGRVIADQVALPFAVMQPLLHRMKTEQLLVLKATAVAGDYVYELTSSGADRARRYSKQSTYFGTAPVPLDAYVAAVEAQSIRAQKTTWEGMRSAFAELVLDDQMLSQVGEGINAGLGFFLYGEPGNGKTSIAERVTAVFSDGIWIPRAISAGGEIIRLFDPAHHEVLPPVDGGGVEEERHIDKRWVRIRRPTIIGGGELKLSNFEITTNPVTGINEASLPLKANGGALVIDDFGRQRFRPEELLNRLIVPLERRVDYLNMPSGRSFRVPYDSLTVLSTNLDPLSLVDEAFLRRIPYKIDVGNPTESQFRDLFLHTAKRKGIACDDAAVDYLVKKHYRQAERQMRFCHARDLLDQVYNACDFRGHPFVVTPQNLDTAVCNYLMLQSRA